MGVYDLYNSALNLANDSLKKKLPDSQRNLLNFKRNYFSGLAFVNMREFWDAHFKKTAEGYGKEIVYTTMALASMANALKEVTKMNGTEIENAATLKAELEVNKAEMVRKNNSIYYDVIPEISSLPKIEKILKVNPISNIEDLNKIKEGKNILDELVPKESKAKVEKYKKEMNDFIFSKLDNQETEIKIVEFLSGLNLPFSIDSIVNNDISEGLWKRISEVQQKGGSLFLTNQILNITTRCEEVSRRLSDIEVVIMVN